MWDEVAWLWGERPWRVWALSVSFLENKWRVTGCGREAGGFVAC